MSTRTVTDRESFFVENKRARDARCVTKDAVINQIFDGIRVRDAQQYTAVLMPSMYGPEVRKLASRGVPMQNMFAIERDRHVHQVLVERAARGKGPPTTPRPLEIQEAVDYIPFEYANLVYLDFFSQPAGSHLRGLIKLFRLGVCQQGTRLLITFGVNRGDTFSCQLNARLNCASLGQAYVEAALKRARCSSYRKLINHSYLTETHAAHFTTTEIWF